MLITRHSKQRGYGVELRAEGCNREVDSIVCAHCGANEWQQDPAIPPSELGNKCTCCDSFICRGCRGKGCMPLAFRMDQWERKSQGLRHVDLPELYDIFRARGKAL
jgi:hypothetical protein